MRNPVLSRLRLGRKLGARCWCWYTKGFKDGGGGKGCRWIVGTYKSRSLYMEGWLCVLCDAQWWDSNESIFYIWCLCSIFVYSVLNLFTTCFAGVNSFSSRSYIFYDGWHCIKRVDSLQPSKIANQSIWHLSRPRVSVYMYQFTDLHLLSLMHGLPDYLWHVAASRLWIISSRVTSSSSTGWLYTRQPRKCFRIIVYWLLRACSFLRLQDSFFLVLVILSTTITGWSKYNLKKKYLNIPP